MVRTCGNCEATWSCLRLAASSLGTDGGADAPRRLTRVPIHVEFLRACPRAAAACQEGVEFQGKRAVPSSIQGNEGMSCCHEPTCGSAVISEYSVVRIVRAQSELRP